MTLASTGNVAATMKHVATLRVWPVLEDLIRIADAADIPICGGVLGAMTYLIDLFNEAQDNKDAHAQLKSTLESYMKTLNDFVSVFPPAYLSHSKAQDATLARDAIRAFDSDIQCVLAIAQQQKAHNGRGLLLRCAYRKQIKSEIDACTRRLEQSHKSFHDAVSNVILGKMLCASNGVTRYDEWGITGAKALSSDAVGRMRSLPGLRKSDDDEFVEAEVDGVDRVVKLFRGERGERVFINALKFLQKNNGPYVQIYGYSKAASTPFIVFHSGALVSFGDYIWQSLRSIQTYPGHALQMWKCAVEIKEAFEFIFTRNLHVTVKLPWKCVGGILEGVMVDASGSIVMDVPDITTTQTCSLESPGAGDTVNLLAHLGFYLNYYLESVPTCLHLCRALYSNPGSILTRKAFEDARLNPYQAMKSLRRFPLDSKDLFLFWGHSQDVPEPGDIVLPDRKKAAVTKRPEYQKIGAMDQVKVTWRFRELSGMEMTQVSDGVYRFVLTPCNSETSLRIPFHLQLSPTDEDIRSFAIKAKIFANDYDVMFDDIYLVASRQNSMSLDEISPSFVSQLSQTISLFLHLDEYPIRYYWTSSTMPLSSNESMAEKDMIESMGVPKMRREWLNDSVAYLHVDEWNIKKYLGGEYDDKAESSDVVVVPGGWDSAW